MDSMEKPVVRELVEGSSIGGAAQGNSIEALGADNGDSTFETPKFDDRIKEDAFLGGGTDLVGPLIAEAAADNKPVATESVNIAREGDSVVDAIHVSVSGSGSAIVGDEGFRQNADGSGPTIAGDEEEKKDSEIEGKEMMVDDSVKLDKRFDQISGDLEEPVNSKSVGVDTDFDKSIKPVTNLNVETAELGEKTDGGVEKDQELNVGAVVRDTVIVDNQDGTKGDACTDKSETAGLINNKEEQETETKPEADSEATRNEPITKIAADGVQFVYSGKEAVGNEDKAVENGAESTTENPTLESKQLENNLTHVNAQGAELENVVSGKSESPESADLSSEAAKHFLEELEQVSGGGSHSGAESSRDHSQRIDGQIVSDSDEEVDTDEEGDGKELFDSAALAALLKAATSASSDSGSITITSPDGSRLFSVDRPAGLGSANRSLKPAPRQNRSNLFTPSNLAIGGDSENTLKLGHSPEDSIVGQVLYRLALLVGRQTGEEFSLDTAKRRAMQLEAEGKDDLNFSLNILVLGKSGVGKSATINSIFGEQKALINAFEPATTTTRDLNDLPLLRTITSSLGPSIWRSAIVTLTHGASAPPDGPSGAPLSYETYVSQRSHVVQQSIGQAVGDLRLMNPSLMNPVSLVENHPSCRKNRDGQKVLPNGQSWRPQLLLLSYSMKILSEASSLSKPQDPFDHRKLFGFRVRAPPLPYLLSWLLQSRTHPKLSAEQGGDNGDSDIDLDDLSDCEQEEDEDEYDQLPPFKPLRKSQIAKLSKEQRKAYFEEYDYRVKLLQKQQWREELKKMREIKKKGKVASDDYGYLGKMVIRIMEVQLLCQFHCLIWSCHHPLIVIIQLTGTGSWSLLHSFWRDQFWTPMLDHDCGYDGVNLEQSLAILGQFPAAVSVQVTKDKKEFNIHLDSSAAAKHGENGSSMAGFDIQNIGKQLAYILRGETKFKILKKNKTAAGFSVTFLGENVATGFKVEDQFTLGKRLVLAGSTGTVRCQGDAAYGANLEVRLREADFPIGQDQSTLGLSLVKWRGDLALGANLQSQFSIGRSSKMAVRVGLNNKLSGQITVKTSSSEQLQIALVGIIPVVMAIYKAIWPGVSENYSIY
ncbi:Translocase of chloroplast 159, chloroplastic [Vitis vinifera]|uniref:Translocase of chloroplast 159, chloroplastic n=1 Tax=Vitis vinifera TaxID=29760 RepID=A0A438F3F1_VITVI|nr:Translocase of chloroplast 159, chloroplastic [Vitis vinifera]